MDASMTKKLLVFVFGSLLCASAQAQQVSHPVGGPSTSTMNELASWNSVWGDTLKQGPAFITNDMPTSISIDGSPLTMRNTTAFTAAQILDAAFILPPSSGSKNYDAVRGVAFAPAATTINLVNGVSAYVVSDAATTGVGGFPATVGLFTAGVARGTNAKVWGINTLLSDTMTGAVSAGTGKSLNNEFDFNISSPNTTVIGLSLAGGSKAQPATAVGVALQPLDLGQASTAGTIARWSSFLLSIAGSTNTFAGIGPKQAVGNSIQSQDIIFGFRDSTGADANIVMTGSESGGLSLFSTNSNARALTLLGGPSRIAMGDLSGININNRIVMQGSGATFALGQDPGFTTQFYGNSAAATTILGNAINLTPAGGGAVTVGAGRLKLASTTYGALTSGNPCNAGALGSLIWITDSTSAVFNATTTGGGTNGVVVGCDGTNWRVR